MLHSSQSSFPNTPPGMNLQWIYHLVAILIAISCKLRFLSGWRKGCMIPHFAQWVIPPNSSQKSVPIWKIIKNQIAFTRVWSKSNPWILFSDKKIRRGETFEFVSNFFDTSQETWRYYLFVDINTTFSTIHSSNWHVFVKPLNHFQQKCYLSTLYCWYVCTYLGDHIAI